MSKIRTLTVAFAAVAGLAGFTGAAAATAANTYSVNGSGTRGGSPKKPKAAKLSAVFTTGTTLGAAFQPKPVIQFKISIEGGRLNTKALRALKSCKPTSKDKAVQSDDQCSKKAIVGGGVLTSVVGAPGTVINQALTCDLPFNLYNVGKGKLGMFIDARPPTCPVKKQEWILIKTKQVGRTVTTTLDVPKTLQLIIPPNTFATVTKSTFFFNKVKAKVKVKVKINGKTRTRTRTQYVTESIGCTDKKRTVSIRFKDIDGGIGKAKKTLKC